MPWHHHHAVILVCDVTNPQAVNNLSFYKSKFDLLLSHYIAPKIIAAAKSSGLNSQITDAIQSEGSQQGFDGLVSVNA